MRTARLSSILLCALFCLSQTFVIAQAPKSKTVKRAAPPKFDSKETAGIFFADAFKDGLSGERPADLGKAPSKIAGTTGNTVPTPSVGTTPASTGAGVFAWSKLISPTTIEDEVKAIKLEVDKDVSTPTDFAGKGYKLARRHFTMLAVMFAITGEYDGDVRWKKDAPGARDLLARSAGNAKVGTEQVYKEAKLRKAELQDLVGGAGFSGGKDADPKADWKSVCDRSPVMQRLELAHQGRLQPFTANKTEFSSNNEKVLHESQLIAALAEVLEKEGMEDADDNEYKGFAIQMKTAALEVVEAVKGNDYDKARAAVGNIGQACSKCHEGFRG
jgi:cytochrome c556